MQLLQKYNRRESSYYGRTVIPSYVKDTSYTEKYDEMYPNIGLSFKKSKKHIDCTIFEIVGDPCRSSVYKV